MFELPPALRAWSDDVRAFVEAELQPHDDAVERTGTIPESARRALADRGFFGLNTAVEFGGRGLSMLATCVAAAELARAHIAFYYLSGVNVHIGSRPVELAGDDRQRRRWLPDLASGRKVAAFALTETGAGSDAAALVTEATADGGGWVLRGAKTFITNAPIAATFTVFARAPASTGAPGISAFVVDADTPGLRVGEPIEMLAGAGCGHAEVRFEDCRVGPDQLLGAEGDGFGIALRALDAGRVVWSAYCAGAAQRLLELAVDHVTTRSQFGAPLARHQHVEFELADLAAAVHAARLVAWEAAWRYDHGDDADRRLASARAKLLNADVVWRVADSVLQLHGGLGYSRRLPIERILREVRVVRILDGTSEMMRRIVGRAALGGRW
ncbi:MAG: hypothetical protein GEV08_05875 [Acidimicrobiia bacterium]|nr:hypothetical protein [Acidimicrobiia bacterium]